MWRANVADDFVEVVLFCGVQVVVSLVAVGCVDEGLTGERVRLHHSCCIGVCEVAHAPKGGAIEVERAQLGV